MKQFMMIMIKNRRKVRTFKTFLFDFNEKKVNCSTVVIYYPNSNNLNLTYLFHYSSQIIGVNTTSRPWNKTSDLPDEVWKNVFDNEQYQISNKKRLKSRKRTKEKILKEGKNGVYLIIRGKRGWYDINDLYDFHFKNIEMPKRRSYERKGIE